MGDARARINLALSILNNAEQIGYSEAEHEAQMALYGADIDAILRFRQSAGCPCGGDLEPGETCAGCGTSHHDPRGDA